MTIVSHYISELVQVKSTPAHYFEILLFEDSMLKKTKYISSPYPRFIALLILFAIHIPANFFAEELDPTVESLFPLSAHKPGNLPIVDIGKVSQIRLLHPKPELVTKLQQQSFDVVLSTNNKVVDLYVTQSELHLLENQDVKFKVIHDDYAAYIARRNLMDQVTGPGSMGGFHTFSEVEQFLDDLQIAYPSIVSSKFSIGSSIEGRPIWVVKVSDNVGLDETEPEVFYNSLIHAREPMSLECLLYFLEYLTSHYGTDDDVTFLINNREMFFLPVFNPDGYVWNETTNPDGGGLWRKNRRGDLSTVWGVDLNRNFGYQWGYDDIGSSSNPSSIQYRGTGPFSEPESQVMRVFVIGREFRTVLNLHSCIHSLIRPWGFAQLPLNPLRDQYLYDAWGDILTTVNNYAYTDAYPTNGIQDDWFYGERSDKPKMYSFSGEVGQNSDGYWPPPSRIDPVVQENIPMELLISWVAGSYVTMQQSVWTYSDQNSSGYPDPGEEAYLSISLQSLGLDDAQSVEAVLTCSSLDVTIVNPTFSVGDLTRLEEINNNQNPFQCQLGSALNMGDVLTFTVTVQAPGVIYSIHALTLIIGTPFILFSDNAESGMSNWTTTGGWNVSRSDFHSKNHSFTDSPYGNYQQNSNARLTMNSSIDLSATGLQYPFLRFWTHWEIESGADFGQVLCSTDQGTTWIALEGKNTSSGSGEYCQPLGEPGYQGTQVYWVEEIIDLSSFLGELSVSFCFKLGIDAIVTFDGWYIDDIVIGGYFPTKKELTGNIMHGIANSQVEKCTINNSSGSQ